MFWAGLVTGIVVGWLGAAVVLFLMSAYRNEYPA